MIAICGLDELERFLGRASYVISVVDPDDTKRLPRMGVKRGRHLVLTCHDVDSATEAEARENRMPGSSCTLPTIQMVQKALQFARQVPPDHFLVVHCSQGISRSPALAFAIMCQASPTMPEADLLREVFRMRPEACPNRLIVELADKLLSR